MRIGAIIQARMRSTRLPGKILMRAAGKTFLEHLMERLAYSKTLDTAIVATSSEPHDDVIADLCRGRGFPLFRGSELDVLDRYYQAARHFALEVIVRVTSDCPLIDPALLDEMVACFLARAAGCDLVMNNHPSTFPLGLECEVMSMSGLARAWENATTPYQREHVDPYFLEGEMRVFNYESAVNLAGKYRWTLDYWEDYLLLKEIFERLDRPGRLITTQEVREFLASHPEVAKLNAKHLPAHA